MDKAVLSELTKRSEMVNLEITHAKSILDNVALTVGDFTDLGRTLSAYTLSMSEKADEVKAAGLELEAFMADRIREQERLSTETGQSINDLKSAIDATKVK